MRPRSPSVRRRGCMPEETSTPSNPLADPAKSAVYFDQSRPLRDPQREAVKTEVQRYFETAYPEKDAEVLDVPSSAIQATPTTHVAHPAQADEPAEVSPL